MEFLTFQNLLVLILLINLLVLLAIWLTKKSQVRLSRLFQLLIFDAAVLYAVFSGIPRREMSTESWIVLAVLILGFVIAPILLYRLAIAFISLFLLPIELRHWRQWSTPAQALIGFAQGTNFPYYAYDEGTDQLQKRLDGNVTSKRIGLGIILLRPEHAVVLHNGAEVSRVEGGDIIFTRRLERIVDVVDLRNHILVNLNVKAITKDGIGVKLVLIAICRIDQAGAPSQPDRLYPFNPDNVFRAVCGQDIEESGRQSWCRLVTQKARRAACDVISTYVLDRLLLAEEPDHAPRSEIRERIKNRLRAEMVGSGIEIIAIGMGNVEPDDSSEGQGREGDEQAGSINVAAQRVNRWQTKWQRRVSERQAEGEASAIRILERARAQALTELINAVDEGFREMADHGNAAQVNHVIALSFVNAVEQMLSHQTLPRHLEVVDTQSTLNEIRRLMLVPVDEKAES